MTIFPSQYEFVFCLFAIESVNDIIKSRCFFLKIHSLILQIFIECFPCSFLFLCYSFLILEIFFPVLILFKIVHFL